jgi:hypothetical protein
VIPGLTGVIVATNARQGEQQRPKEVVAGFIDRITPGKAA